MENTKNLGKFNIKTIKVLIKGPWIYKRDTWKWYLLFCTWKVCDQQWKYTFIYNCFKLANKPIFGIRSRQTATRKASVVNNDDFWRSFKRWRVKMSDFFQVFEIFSFRAYKNVNLQKVSDIFTRNLFKSLIWIRLGMGKRKVLSGLNT